MSASIIKKRLYVGGLAENVTENELTDRFARFVSVSNLTLKSRSDSEGNHIKSFAHLDIRGTEENIKKCFSAYQNAKWKGSTMKLQDAKENFIERLESEREEQRKEMLAPRVPEERTKEMEWKPPELSTENGGAVPGTPVPGKKDWVVGKYGRVLPILNVKKSYKTKVVKHDPSKFCHAAKVFKDKGDADTEPSTHCDSLTWEIDTPDSEITKKRKGEFPPPSSPTKKPKPFPAALLSKLDKNLLSVKCEAFINRKKDDLEIVKLGQNASLIKDKPARSKFDSDYESDEGEEPTMKLPIHKTANHLKSTPSKKDRLKTVKQNESCIPLKNIMIESDGDSDSESDEKLPVSNKKNRIESTSFKKQDCKLKITKKIHSPVKNETKESDDGDHERDDNIKSTKKRDGEFKMKNNELDVDDSSDDDDCSDDDDDEDSDDDNSDDDSDGGDGDKLTIRRRSIPEFKGIGMLMSSQSKKNSLDKKTVISNSNQAKKLTRMKESQLSDLRQNDDGEEEEEEESSEEEEGESDEEEEESEEEEQEENEKNARKVEIQGAKVTGLETNETDDSEEDESSDDDEEDSSDDEEEDSSDDEEEDSSDNELEKKVNTDVSKSTHSSKNTTPTQKKSILLDKIDNVVVKSSSELSKLPKNSNLHKCVELSEFASEIPESTPLSNSSPLSDQDSDSHDSDLDSNDFEMVAKKLAAKAAEDKKQKSSPGQSLLKNLPHDIHSQEKITANENKRKRSVTENSNKGMENAAGKKRRKEETVEIERLKPASIVQRKLTTLASGQGDVVSKDAIKLDGTEGTSDEKPVALTKQEADNVKRLQAVKEQIQIRQRKKNLMKSALRNVDTASSKRIVFSSSDEDDEDVKDNDKQTVKSQSGGEDQTTTNIFHDSEKTTTVSKVSILGGSSEEDSDDDDVEEMFKSKPQFEGKKGEKLMKMQKSFGDSRFKLDEKFIDSDDSDDEDDNSDDGDRKAQEGTDATEKKDDDQEVSLVAERQRNLEVLESVVGKHKVDKLTAKLKRDNITIVDMNKLRFDPTKMKAKQEETEKTNDLPTSVEGSKETNEKKISKSTSKKEENKEEEEGVLEPKTPTLEVTKSKVTLSDSLVDMLKTKRGKGMGDEGTEETEASSFSLLDMFNKDDTTVGKDREETPSSHKPLSGLLLISQDKGHKMVTGQRKDDNSSDSEDDMEVETTEENNNLKLGLKSFMNLQEEDVQDDDHGDDSDDEDDDKKDDEEEKKSHLNRIQIKFDPVKFRERALRDAGRVDVRFSKEEWQDRFSDIKQDLLLTCKKRYKDAKKKKRVEDEHNRKKAMLKKAGKGGWWKKKK